MSTLYNNISILAICGPEDSGKSTVSRYLSGKITGESIEYINIENIETVDVVIKILFNVDKNSSINDSIWNLSYLQLKDILYSLFRKLIDSNYEFPRYKFCPSYDINSKFDNVKNDKNNKNIWYHLSFATPLKIISSIMFSFPNKDVPDIYPILLGETELNRKLREEIKTIDYDICGSLTGRKCLEFLGTDVFRNNFDNDIWIKIAERTFSICNILRINIVMDDTRFENEGDFMQDNGAAFLLLFEKESDLVLDDSKLSQHPAKWTFLKFIFNRKKLFRIHNCEHSLKQLYTDVDSVVNQL